MDKTQNGDTSHKMNEQQSEQERTVRRRAKVDRTSKGYSISVTVEITGPHNLEEFMKDLDRTFTAVDEAYPRSTE